MKHGEISYTPYRREEIYEQINAREQFDAYEFPDAVTCVLYQATCRAYQRLRQQPSKYPPTEIAYGPQRPSDETRYGWHLYDWTIPDQTYGENTVLYLPELPTEASTYITQQGESITDIPNWYALVDVFDNDTAKLVEVIMALESMGHDVSRE